MFLIYPPITNIYIVLSTKYNSRICCYFCLCCILAFIFVVVYSMQMKIMSNYVNEKKNCICMSKTKQSEQPQHYA